MVVQPARQRGRETAAVVAAAGVQTLRPGQKVSLLGAE
jgi:hypothetical protein